MATYGTDLTTMTDAESGTWVELSNFSSGGAPAADGENWIQGQDCMSQTTSTKSGLVFSIAFDYGSNLTFSAGDVVLMWQYYAVISNLQPFSSGGFRAGIWSDTSNGNAYAVGGSDQPYAASWKNIAIDPTKSADYTDGSGNGGSYRYFASLPYTVNAIAKGTPHAVDAIRYGRGEIYCTGTGCDFAGMAQYNDYNDGTNGYNRYGLFQLIETDTYKWKGLMSIGQSGTSATFSDSNKTILIDDTPAAYATFNKIQFLNASTTVTWVNITFTALGSTSPGLFDNTNNTVFSWTGCTFNYMNTFLIDSNGDAISCTFNSCGQIDIEGGDVSGSKVLTSTVAADSSAVVWDVATDPQNYMDNMEFSEGGNAHHAIEFGTTSPTTINLTGIAFTGFSTSNGQNNSTFYIGRTSGTVTINTTECTGNLSYKTAGATVTINQDQVAHSLTGLVNGSEVTYMARGTAVDTGSDGSTTANSRNFVTTNSWSTDAYKGFLLYVTSGADAGRYYVSGNSATTLYLDSPMTATASSLTWELYDENDDTEVFHVESVTGGFTTHTYTYTSDQDVDITILHTGYVDIMLPDVTLGNSSQSIPITQQDDYIYFNP